MQQPYTVRQLSKAPIRSNLPYLASCVRSFRSICLIFWAQSCCFLSGWASSPRTAPLMRAKVKITVKPTVSCKWKTWTYCGFEFSLWLARAELHSHRVHAPSGFWGLLWLLRQGPRVFWRTLRDVYAIVYMMRGYSTGTIVYGVFAADKPATR